jgi:hypothetical protein
MFMTPQELYEIWAPPDSLWSVWAKPVLFAQMNLGKRKTEDAPSDTPPFDAEEAVSWARNYRHGTAIVLDLPGETTVELAMQLAQMGFRPVPLYNCANSDASVIIVPVAPIITALARNASLLSTIQLAPDAPPVFMLDSRRDAGPPPSPKDFDNRWVIFPQDFPSAIFLQAQGIQRVLIVQGKRKSMLSTELEADLYQVAQRWHTGGIEIETRHISLPNGAAGASETIEAGDYTRASTPLTFGRLSRFRLGAVGVAATLFAVAARRSSGGGFGRIIPDPSSTGGG